MIIFWALCSLFIWVYHDHTADPDEVPWYGWLIMGALGPVTFVIGAAITLAEWENSTD